MTSATDWSRAVVAIAAANEDPYDFGEYDYVLKLQTIPDNPGALNDDFWRMFAYRAAGIPAADPRVQTMKQVILANQRGDGSWCWQGGTSASCGSLSWSTSSAILALRVAEAPSDLDAIRKALDFLKAQQHQNGLFIEDDGHPSSAGTGSVIQALWTVGENPLSAEWTRDANPVDALLSLQEPEGAFRHNHEQKENRFVATTQVLPGLRGAAFPYIPPVANIVVSPGSPVSQQPVTFTSASTDKDGSVVRHAWAFGDGATASGQAATYAFAGQGTFVVRLKAWDDDGLTATAERTVVVTNAPPVPKLSAPSDALRAVSVELSALGSSDADGSVTAYRFDFGDGNATDWSESPIARHAYARLGRFTVTVSVRDSDGAVASASVRIDILNQPPTVVVPTALTADRLTPLRPAATSHDPDGAIASWRWDFGDGFTSTAERPEHRYADLGTFPLRVAVRDSDGAEAAASTNVTVVNLPPRVLAVSWQPSPAYAGEEVRLRVDADDADGGVKEATWRIAGLSTPGWEVVVTLEQPGASHGAVEVLDNDGGVVSSAFMVPVFMRERNNAPVITFFSVEPEAPVEGEEVVIRAEAFDDEPGLGLTLLLETSDGAREWRVERPPYEWRDSLPVGVVRYRLNATDAAGLAAELEGSFVVLQRGEGEDPPRTDFPQIASENRPPMVRVDAVVVEGRRLILAGSGEDPEGLAFTVTAWLQGLRADTAGSPWRIELPLEGLAGSQTAYVRAVDATGFQGEVVNVPFEIPDVSGEIVAEPLRETARAPDARDGGASETTTPLTVLIVPAALALAAWRRRGR